MLKKPPTNQLKKKNQTTTKKPIKDEITLGKNEVLQFQVVAGSWWLQNERGYAGQ